MTLIMAFDPGTTTGVAWLEDDKFGSTQLDENSLYEFVDEACERIGHAQIERFIINAASVKKDVVYDSLYLIGFLRYASWRCGFPIGYSKPADVMTPFSDDALKRIGWHRPGMVHANDAARHLAWYCVRSKLISGKVFLP